MISDTTPNAGRIEDVDLGVPEYPEQVLPQQRVGALGHVEEVGVEQPVERQQEQRHRDHGQGEHQQQLGHEPHPREHRHLHQRHARRPHVEHGHHQVDGTDQRGDAGELEADGVEVHAVAGRERHARVGGVGEPAAVGAATEEPRRVQHQTAGQEAPEAERVHAGERHVPGAHLQRHQVVHERRAERDDDEEDHRHAVHREQLVVELGRVELALGRCQLQADQHAPRSRRSRRRTARPRRT